jgi:CubicO group peptidase (beta-lactamase class C family)
MTWPQLEEALDGSRTGDRSLVVGARLGGETRFWHRGDLPDGQLSIFEIGSITKVFTATLLADLVQDGVVAFRDPVAAHLPAAPPVKERPITLEDLATHRSGLPRLPTGMLVRGMTVERGDPYASLDDERMLRAIRETEPKRAPGTKFGYSNHGAGLLGYALARAAGTTYAGLLADRITRPLGLGDTGVLLPPGAESRLAAGHGWWGRPAGRWDLAGLAGAGGLVSTAADLLRFLELHSPDADSRLALAAAETARKRYDVNRMMGVGLGWVILPALQRGPRKARLAHDVLMHDGGTGGYRSFAAVAPETGTAVVVLTGHARSVTGLGLQLVRAVL